MLTLGGSADFFKGIKKVDAFSLELWCRSIYKTTFFPCKKSRRGQHSFRLFLSIDAFFTLSWYFHPSTLNRLPRMYFTYIGILNCCRAIEIFELFVAKTSVDGTLIAP